MLREIKASANSVNVTFELSFSSSSMSVASTWNAQDLNPMDDLAVKNTTSKQVFDEHLLSVKDTEVHTVVCSHKALWYAVRSGISRGLASQLLPQPRCTSGGTWLH